MTPATKRGKNPAGLRRNEKGPAGMVGPAEPGAFGGGLWCAVGLAIPRPDARLQSRTPLDQAGGLSDERPLGID